MTARGATMGTVFQSLVPVVLGTTLRSPEPAMSPGAHIARNAQLSACVADRHDERAPRCLASSPFTVTCVGPSALRVMNAKGQRLTLTPNESSVPLGFHGCEREPLWMYPAVNDEIAAGQAGFWILSKAGIVGPSAVSPLLMPRSNLRVWFRIEPVH
jgi:hypothetical protein